MKAVTQAQSYRMLKLPKKTECASYVSYSVTFSRFSEGHRGRSCFVEGEKGQPTDTRGEFRAVLRQIVSCLRTELDVPGVAPFDAEELRQWLQNITTEDIQSVWDDKSCK